MSETFRVPLEGSNVRSEGGSDSAPLPVRNDVRIRPATTRIDNSLHRVRMGDVVAKAQAEFEAVPEWREVENDYGDVRAEVSYGYKPVERAAAQETANVSPTVAAMQREVDMLTTAVNMMARNYVGQNSANYGGENYMSGDNYGDTQQTYGNEESDMARQSQQRGRLRMPSADDYDLYDAAGAEAYKRAVDEYVDSRVASAIQPHKQVLDDNRHMNDYNLAVTRYGDDPRFKEIMGIALQEVKESNGKLDILTAYQQADNRDNAKAGQKGNAHLPASLRGRDANGKSRMPRFGAIMAHNAQSGRARPFKNRGR